MGNRRKSKGTIIIETRGKGNMLSLRWTYQRQRYRLSIGLPHTPTNRRAAEAIAGQIQTDIALGNFDSSLEKYRRGQEDRKKEPPTVSLFEQFIQYRRNEGTSGQSIAARYHPLLANLKRFGQDVESADRAQAFVEVLRSRQSARIANQNLSLLKGFGQWSFHVGAWGSNYFEGITPLKGAKRRLGNREPFTQEEVALFMATIKADPVRAHYHDLCYFIVSLGLRPSEAIGLRWCHLDLSREIAVISESLSRGEEGQTAGYARQRKLTKTENRRTIPLTETLMALLEQRRTEASKPDELIFTSKTGKPIDDRNFSQRVWKPICKAAGIPHRPPYVGRHTLISHGIESGWTLPQAAQIAGHSSTRMVAETYGHFLTLPKMPDFKDGP